MLGYQVDFSCPDVCISFALFSFGRSTRVVIVFDCSHNKQELTIQRTLTEDKGDNNIAYLNFSREQHQRESVSRRNNLRFNVSIPV